MLYWWNIVTVTVICELLVFSFSFTVSNGDQLYENDTCKMHDGSEGVCAIAIKCPWFVSNVYRNKLVQYGEHVRCGFNRNDEIVCCPKEPKKQTVVPPDEGNSNRLTSRVSSRKAAQACLSFLSTTRLVEHIVEGEIAEEGDVPFIAALGYESTNTDRQYDWGCGSSLISTQFLLTAAHCIRAARRPVVARMGTLNLERFESTDAVQDTLLKRFHPHPEYTPRSKYNDIALIQVETPFKYDDNVTPVCLHMTLDDLPPTHTLTASGWGLTGSDESRSDNLLKVSLTTKPLDQCDKEYRAQLGSNNDKLELGVLKTQYCAIGLRNDTSGRRRDSCQGDSGGPLHYKSDKEERFYLVGITSFGLGCGETASIYTRVAAYLDWIEPIVWPDSST